MKAYLFPGQGAQFVGMGKILIDERSEADNYFSKAEEILEFSISSIMFHGSEEELKQTRVTQPAIFLTSVVDALTSNNFNPAMVAGHSLGEFSALVASGALSFEDGLILVSKRAMAMQEACEKVPSSMAAVIGLGDDVVEGICKNIEEVVVPANYNCPGQLVISGSNAGIDMACEKLKEAGAKRAIKLPVGGAFHSPLMDIAKNKLKEAIEATTFNRAKCTVFQNVDASPHTDPDEIKQNLIAQLTAPVRWTQTIENMIARGVEEFIEPAPGKVLQGLVKKIDRTVKFSSL